MKKIKILIAGIISLIWISCFCSAWFFYFSSTDWNGYYRHNFSTYGANSLYQLYGCNVPANCIYSVYIHTWNDYKREIYTSDELNAAANWNNYINIIGSSCNTRFNCSNVKSEFLNYTLAPACSDTLYISQGGETSQYELSWTTNTLYLDPWLSFSTWLDDWYQFYVAWQVCETGTENSVLFINNIEHQTAPIIKVTIPEEIQRDSNVDSEEFNLDVEWYGYDQEKMQNIVNTQYYQPTGEEMSNLIWKIADFLPLIAVALLILRIWRVIKKVFRF